MARPLRLASPEAVSHGTSRGTARQRLDADEADRETYLAVLEAVVRRDHWLCHALCLMDTHDHLVIETPEGNLSAGMRQLNGVSTQKFTRRCARAGNPRDPPSPTVCGAASVRLALGSPFVEGWDEVLKYQMWCSATRTAQGRIRCLIQETTNDPLTSGGRGKAIDL
jgi:hypothetical protein